MRPRTVIAAATVVLILILLGGMRLFSRTADCPRAPAHAMPDFQAACWRQTLAQGHLRDRLVQRHKRASLIVYEGASYRVEETRVDTSAWRVRRVVLHNRLIVDAGTTEALRGLAPRITCMGWHIRARIPGTGCASIVAPAGDLRTGIERERVLRQALAGRAAIEAEALEPLAGTPNDSDWDQQWNAIAIGAPEAWDLSTGDGELVVPVFDTGVALTHADLQDNIFVNDGEVPDNGIDDDRNGYVDDVHGWDFLDGDADPSDTGGHGTHVAGIIGARGDNELGTAGILWRVRIMPIRVGSMAGINTYAERSALEYVRRWRTRRQAPIVASNHSYGAVDDSPSEQRRKAIARYRDAGILFIAGAGNSSADNDVEPHYPSSFDLADFPDDGDWDNVLAVGAHNEAGARYSGSNIGRESVDLMAPGAEVWSVYDGGTTIPRSGTSQAAPHLTGAAGLLASVHSGLDGERLRAILLATATPNAAFTDLVATGGVLDLASAAARAHALPQVTITAPADGTFIAAGQAVELAAAVSDGDGTVVRIEAWRDGTCIASDEAAADDWQLRWSAPVIGRHHLRLVAIDDDDNRVQMREPFTVDYGVVIRDDLDLSLDAITGTWDEITLDDGMFGESALQLLIPSGEESVDYDFSVPVAGQWAIEARWPASSLASQATAYVVQRAAGDDTYVVDQRSGGGAWHELDRWQFDADANVTVSVRPTDGVYRVRADAIRLRQIAAPTRAVALDNQAGTIEWTAPELEGSVDGDTTVFDGLDPHSDHDFQPMPAAGTGAG